MDLLEITCEGAELDVLEGIESRPKTIILEGHAQYDVSVSQ